MANFFRDWIYGQDPDEAKRGLLKSTTFQAQASHSAFVQEVNDTSSDIMILCVRLFLLRGVKVMVRPVRIGNCF